MLNRCSLAPPWPLMIKLVTCEHSQLPKLVVEVVDIVVSNFHEGWERKEGVEEGEKWRRSRAAADDRPVDEKSSTGRRTVRRQNQGRKEEKKGKRKVMGEMGAAWDVKGC